MKKLLLLLTFMMSKGLMAAPIHDAVIEGNIAEVERLIRDGADVDQVDHEHNTPLYLATWHRFTEIAKLLLENGADVNATDLYGCPPMFWAVTNNDIETVKLLISAGADINITDVSNATCIHLTAEDNYKEIMLLFLESPFNDHTIRNLLNKTAEQIARQIGHDEIAKLLANRPKLLEQRIAQSKDGKLKHLAAISVNKIGITEEEYQTAPYSIKHLITNIIEDEAGPSGY